MDLALSEILRMPSYHSQQQHTQARTKHQSHCISPPSRHHYLHGKSKQRLARMRDLALRSDLRCGECHSAQDIRWGRRSIGTIPLADSLLSTPHCSKPYVVPFPGAAKLTDPQASTLIQAGRTAFTPSLISIHASLYPCVASLHHGPLRP
jgi:hypothetical protein